MMMREGSAALVRREDYLAPAYWIRQAELSFDLDAAKTIVGSKLTMERNLTQERQPLRLNAEDLNLLRVLVNGQSVSFRHEDSLLVIDAPEADQFVLEIRNTIAPDKNTQLSGLYASGSGLFTQCEAEGFRRITCYLDRPDVMAQFTVTLRADKARYPVLLSNGNLVEQGELDNGRHYVKWHDPFPKPAYLFAVVAADLVAREQRIVTRSGKEHLLQIFVKRGDLEKTEHAMNSLIASIVWDEARFKLPLDLERFMIVAVDDFNMGAMENKGLNIFNTKFVLASENTATDDDFDGIESVVGHEYFHNWSGNRVTCRDWFQLSLKEGLTVFRDQEFSMDMAGAPVADGGPVSARAVRRIADVRTLRERQFPEDAGPMAHPVRPEAYQAIDNFYTPTVYEKGAEVVRMMHTLVGRDGFAAGMARYFQRHDGQAVTCDDFAQAIADANPGSPLAYHLPQFKRWYSQAGTPRLQARGEFDAGNATFTLTLTQSNHGQPPQVLPIAMGLLARGGQALTVQLDNDAYAWSATERVLVMTEAEQRFTFTGITEDCIPSLLRGYSAPVQLDDGLADADLLVLMAHDADAFNRWEAGQRLLLSRIRQALAADSVVLDEALANALQALLRDATLAPSFKALALTLPSEGYVAEQVSNVDPQRIHAVCDSLRLQLAARLQADWAWAYETHQVLGAYAPNTEQSGRRALANLALAMLTLQAVTSGDAQWPGRAFQRSKDASNMTERLGAIEALVNAHAELATPALERFHAQFRSHPLALDKWFMLQARAREQDGKVFARVKQLLQHPDFTLANPNRARALVFSLTQFNPAAFHRADAAGYVFWAERVIELDAINPQIASRLARALDRWRSLAEPYRGAARVALERVAAKVDLSGDTREIITRSLQD